MAEDTVSAAASIAGRGRPYKHEYTPPAAIPDVPGLRKSSDSTHADTYRGTKAELLALGLLLPHQFPGEPGMPAASVTLWPAGTPPGSSWRTPWRVTVNRNPSGRFTLAVVVSEAEQLQRQALADAEQAARDAEWAATKRVREAERRAGASLEEIIRELGLPAVVARVEKLRRQACRPRAASHLRLAWSAPNC
jgi:hypothetical protein